MRTTALAGGLLMMFGLTGGACAARQAPSKPPAPAAAAKTATAPKETPETIETTDARLAAALAGLKSRRSAATLRQVADEYLRLGVYDQSVTYLNQAIALSPRDGSLLNARAIARRNSGSEEGALGDARRAVFLLPDSGEAYNTLGTIQFALGFNADASRSFERALELAPGAAWALNNLCYVALIEGDEAAAVARCTEALEHDPSMQTARNNLATAHASAGRIDDARATLFGGERTAALFNMGIIQLARRDYTAAAESFGQACRETPSFDAACRRATEARALAMRTPAPVS